MTTTSFEACLQAAKAANVSYRENTTAFRLAQEEMASQRDALHLEAVEAAVTAEEVRAAIKLCPKNSQARSEGFFKMFSLATSIEEMQAVRSQISRGGIRADRRYNDEVVTKWAKFSIAEVEAATNRDEMWNAYHRCQLPTHIDWYGWEGTTKYVYPGPSPWEIVEAYLTQPYRDCATLEEVEEVEKKYGSSGDIMRSAWREAHDRLYKEKHGVAPKYSSLSMF